MVVQFDVAELASWVLRRRVLVFLTPAIEIRSGRCSLIAWRFTRRS